MLTIDARGTLEKLLADYAVADNACRQATERRQDALRAVTGYVENHEATAIRNAIEFHDNVPWKAPVAWLRHKRGHTDAQFDVSPGSAQPAPSQGWFPVYDKRIDRRPEVQDTQYRKYEAADPVGSNWPEAPLRAADVALNEKNCPQVDPNVMQTFANNVEQDAVDSLSPIPFPLTGLDEPGSLMERVLDPKVWK